MNSLSKELQDLNASSEFTVLRKRAAGCIQLAEKIYGRRKDLAMTQQALARLAGTTQAIISRLETGDYDPEQGIGDGLYKGLATALQVDKEYLVSELVDRRTLEVLWFCTKQVGELLSVEHYAALLSRVEKALWTQHHFRVSHSSLSETGIDRRLYLYIMLLSDPRLAITYQYLAPYLECMAEVVDNTALTPNGFTQEFEKEVLQGEADMEDLGPYSSAEEVIEELHKGRGF